MDIFFILLGIAMFFAASAVFTMDHYRVNPPQALVAFLLPPFAWWLYSHYWERSQAIFRTQVAAAFLFLIGIIMMASIGSSERALLVDDLKIKTSVEKIAKPAQYVGSNLAFDDLSKAERLSKGLNGRLEGELFLFNNGIHSVDSAEFDQFGTLRIKQGAGFFGRFEIAIDFNEPPIIGDSWTKTIRAQSSKINNEETPVIYVSWYDLETRQMQSRKYESGYNLDFSLEHDEYNKFHTQMQLVLPDSKQSFLVGNFSSYNSPLRFHGGGLLRSYDSIETLEIIAVQTLEITFRKHFKQIIGFEGSDFDTLNIGDGAFSKLYIRDAHGTIRKISLTFYRAEDNWLLAIKGLENQFKSTENIVSKVPSKLNPPMQIDSNRMGLIKPFAPNTQSLTDDSVGAVSAPVVVLSEVDSVQNNEQKPNKEILTSEQAATKSRAESRTEDLRNEIIEKTTLQNNAANKTVDSSIDEAEMIKMLLPLMNKEVELSTTKGKFKTGLYVGIYRKQIILEIELGGGVVEYLTEVMTMKSLRVLKSSDASLQFVEFYHPPN